MSYYISEKLGNGYLRAGFQVLECSSGVMTYCLEFMSKCVAEVCCHLLTMGFDRIYKQYVNTSPQLGVPIFWITTSNQSWLRCLKPGYDLNCQNLSSYNGFYTFMNKADRDKAMKEMQEYMDVLYLALKKIDF